MKKIKIKKYINAIGLLPIIEQANFFKQKWKNRKSNRLFRQNNPDVKLPPDFYLYETFNLNYDKFYTNGEPTAEWLVNLIKPFKEFKNLSILDWGCGTGRIIRHLPAVIDDSNSIFGTDYNPKYIKWCAENLEGISFKLNGLKPPLDFKDRSMDVVYGISIFTHLSEDLHYSWMKELVRILKNEGVLFLTTHGDAHKFKLLEDEQIKYDSGNLVEHSFKKEGNRLYASYQSPKFFHKLCKEFHLKILKHIPGEIRNNKPQQDVWILQSLKN